MITRVTIISLLSFLFYKNYREWIWRIFYKRYNKHVTKMNKVFLLKYLLFFTFNGFCFDITPTKI